MEWQPIETAPKDNSQVLAAFNGQFGWVIFVAWATHDRGVHAAGFANPSHWMPLPQPPSN